ncbi:hypothetical protein [Paenilisteria rocourtiae]|uniref:Uncharacterized protein n=2 Tax=Listeria rocourtiae TaxID=647910 RepID=A0A4R6ZPU1_9LIST|nr:hypothetical protein [Listeria rocourtiae]EUJ42466.1 hypothetical protein PROCOU_17124 [Listeria rocourtiae FSL F6-920]TDR54601.1 hypothetical protein DFP96_102189 [Listeria rocourtiae]
MHKKVMFYSIFTILVVLLLMAFLMDWISGVALMIGILALLLLNILFGSLKNIRWGMIKMRRVVTILLTGVLTGSVAIPVKAEADSTDEVIYSDKQYANNYQYRNDLYVYKDSKRTKLLNKQRGIPRRHFS